MRFEGQPGRIVDDLNVQKYSRGRRPGGLFGGNIGESEVHTDFNEERLIYKCRLDPSVDNSGYAGVVRVVRNGGSARMDGDTLVVENASSVMLLTRIEWFADYSEDKVEALRQAVEQLSPDYDAILERHRKVQSEAMNRVTVDFGGASQYGMSSEELLADQRSRQDYSPALLEKIFEMGRYWFMYTSGKYPTHGGRDQCQYQPANCARRAGRSARRHGCLLQLDGEPGPGLPGERKEYLRDARHPLFPLPATKCRRLLPLLLGRIDRRDLASSLLAFRRRLVRSPVLGSLSGHRRCGVPAQPHRAGI